MYSSQSKARKPIIRMDPDCAICCSPAQAACDCEAKGLEMAIKEAEDRIMRPIYTEIRSWVRGHAQDYILEYFRLLADRRKKAHSEHLENMNTQAWYHYNAPPHPQSIIDARQALKRGIDEDWQASVQRYPEVLSYFFSLVELTLPADEDPAVRDPPLGALNGQRKVARRGAVESGHGRPPALAASAYAHGGGVLPPRTPPPPLDRHDRYERRTPAPREKRSARHSLPPQHAPYNFNSHAPYM